MASRQTLDKIRSLGDFLVDVLLILRNKRRLKGSKVLPEYLKVRLTGLLFRQKKTETFCGWRYSFFNYSEFITLVSHTFIRNEYFFETSSKTPFIIDCGANIGDSVIYFKSLYPQAKILAFEPDDLTVNKLVTNIKDNNLLKVTIENKAVSDSNKTVRFYRSARAPGAVTMSLFKERLHRDSVTVKTVRLSDYINRRVDFLKIDVEGAEGQIIKDLDQAKKLKFVRKMIVEYHHHLGGKTNKLPDILSRLGKNGFDFQLATDLKTPFIEGIFQDVLIYAYTVRKNVVY